MIERALFYQPTSRFSASLGRSIITSTFYREVGWQKMRASLSNTREIVLEWVLTGALCQPTSLLVHPRCKKRLKHEVGWQRVLGDPELVFDGASKGGQTGTQSPSGSSRSSRRWKTNAMKLPGAEQGGREAIRVKGASSRPLHLLGRPARLSSMSV